MNAGCSHLLWSAALIGTVAQGWLRAETVTLAPVADATLIEVAPTNSLGGAPFFNAGTTQNFTRNHGLLRFDPLQKIPPGSSIVSVRLTVEVERRPSDGFASVQMGLHRMLKSWGEGATVPKRPDSSPGLGGAAATGDATWTHRFFNTTNVWAEPGGAVGVDYLEAPSSTTVLFGVEDSPYEFPSTTGLVGDVQQWLDYPDENQGWMIRPVDERPNFTARRLGSREGNAPPVLFVDYIPPPPAPWVLSLERLGEGSATLRFRQAAGSSCRVEASTALESGTWTVIREFSAEATEAHREVTIELAGESTYFRVVFTAAPRFGKTPD